MKFKQMLLPILIGAISGFLIGFYLIKSGTSLGNIYLLFFYFLVSTFLVTIIHEGGHLVFGLLTGYQFISFRIMNIILIKQDDKLKLRRIKIAGTDGQCLMSPPKPINNTIPFFWYNIGGVLLNLIVGIVSLLLSKNSFAFIFGITNILIALLNGIPINTGMINNDGKNIVELSRDPSLPILLYKQLKINALYSQNVPLKEMPESLFTLDDDSKGDMAKAIIVFQCNRMMEQHDFQNVYYKMDNLIKEDIIGLYKNMLTVDLLYCQLVLDDIAFDQERYNDKQFQSFISGMKNYPSVLRLQYAYNTLIAKDKEKANQFIKRIDDLKNTYPYPCEIESELELIQIVKEKGDE